jgi:hypothetical protein
MSWWNAKYKNGHGEYEITFASKDYEKAKVVEKICQAIIDKRIKSREDLQPLFSGWISVAERLPEDEKPVLVYYGFMHKEGRGTGLRYTGTLSYFRFDPQPHWQHESTGLIVTHWMPLPKPPTEEEV